MAIAQAIDPEHPLVARMLTGISRSNLALGQVDEAEDSIRRALTIFRRKLPADHWRIAYAQSVLGACLTKRGRFREAELLLVEAFPRIRQRLGDREPRARDARRLVLQHYEERNMVDEAALFRAQTDRRTASIKTGSK